MRIVRVSHSLLHCIRVCIADTAAAACGPASVHAHVYVCVCGARFACCLWCDEPANERIYSPKWNWMSAPLMSCIPRNWWTETKHLNNTIYLYLQQRIPVHNIYQLTTWWARAYTPATIIDTCIGYETPNQMKMRREREKNANTEQHTKTEWTDETERNMFNGFAICLCELWACVHVSMCECWCVWVKHWNPPNDEDDDDGHETSQQNAYTQVKHFQAQVHAMVCEM